MRSHTEIGSGRATRRVLFVLATVWCCALSQPAPAQLASVRCCVVQEDLLAVGKCMSGPGNLDEPAACEPAGACVLGFGSDTGEMAAMCDPADPKIPEQDPGFCESWSDGTTTVLAQCVAVSNDSLDLFNSADSDGDGDLDLADVADYINHLEPAPNLNQSPARIVSVECCYPESATRNVGACMSGPDDTIPPPACSTEGVCTIGFSAAVRPGDSLFGMCGLPPFNDTGPAYCTSWVDDTAPSVQKCTATIFSGLNPFFVFDADGDVDVDIEDLAEFQNTFELPTGSD